MSRLTRRLREWCGRALLVGLSVLLTLAGLEGAFRVAAQRRGGGKEGLEGQGYTTYDPLLGWRKRPGARVVYHRREYRVELVVNSRGLRDPERGYDAEPGTLRILALGDSFAEGYTVPLHETVTQQLETLLVRAGRRAQVVNGATLAYSTDQEYLFYRVEGARYLPRIVLLFFYYNDVLFNDREHYFGLHKPAFRLTSDGRLELRRPVVRRRTPPAPIAEAPDPRPGRGGSQALEWLRERLYGGAPRIHDDLAGLGLWEPIRPRPVRLELRVFQRELPRELAPAWDLTDAILAQLAREAAARGSELLVVYVPSRMEVQDDSWEAMQAQYGLSPGGWDRRRVAARLERAGRRGGYPVLDLTPALRAADRRFWGRPYHRFDGHWTALGHRVAAREIHAFLERHAWVHGSP